mgnify:CR=1 FL=1
MYQIYFKRLFDILFSIILIIFLSPVMILVFFFVWLNIGFPIFKQKRPGLNNKVFTLYKFKTLHDIKKNIPENKRVNKIGNFLRITGLDELPQLFNILFNKMSFVGPRPLLIKYLKINEFKNHNRKKIKPGITGLAQIEIFNTKKKIVNKWKKQFELDNYYYNNLTFYLDLKILFKTFLKLFRLSKQDYHSIKEIELSGKYIK